MPRKKKGLSILQQKVLDLLKKNGKIYWTRTMASQTHSLTSLVKRGIVEVKELDNNGDYQRGTYWILK